MDDFQTFGNLSSEQFTALEQLRASEPKPVAVEPAPIPPTAQMVVADPVELFEEEDWNDIPPQFAPPTTPSPSGLVRNYSDTHQWSYPALADDRTEVIQLPSINSGDIDEVFSKIPAADIEAAANGERWKDNHMQSVNKGLKDNALHGTVMDETAMFRQSVQSEAGELISRAPTALSRKPGQELDVNTARIMARKAFGLGGLFQVGLWHSGIWLRLTAPEESALIEVYNQIARDRVTLGRQTYGLLLSNWSSYTSSTLMDFVVEHIQGTNLILKETDNIRDHISVLDLPVVIWAMACAIWPNGFNYIRSCVALPKGDEPKCTHEVKERLDLSKLQFTNIAELTKAQVKHMAQRRASSVSVEAVKAYKEDFIKGQRRSVILSPDVEIMLSIESVEAHINAGQLWVSEIEEAYGKAMMADENKRNQSLLMHGYASICRQYAHFVEGIRLYGGELVTSRPAINAILTDMSANDDLRDAFVKAVGKYLEDSVISLIALPTYTCPKCNQEQSAGPGKKFPGLLPLDVYSLFFTLAPQKLMKIAKRG
jgi:hypothetical protein